MKVRRLFKRYIFFIFLSAALPATQIFAKADWTVLVYAQAKNNLARFAARNFSDMSKVGSNNKLNILVQWYQPNKNGAFRYKIDKNKMFLDACLQTSTDGNKVSDLVGAMKWAVTKCPAKKYLLVLWNHGVGILDPVWRPSGLSFSSKLMSTDPKMQKEDLEFISDHRGILFNEHSRTYMNNQQLVEALHKIKTNVLGGKKIDILGMDACLMAMVEVAYQARNYASYLVGSQEVELAHGWDYFTIMNGLTQGNITPLQLSQGIVLAYENYYKNKIRFYTQSAVQLEHMSLVKDGINQIVCNINSCKKHDKGGMKRIIKEARSRSIKFSTKSYVDLHSFYSNIQTLLCDTYLHPKRNMLLSIDDMKTRKLYKKTKKKKSKKKKTSAAKKVKNEQLFLKTVKELNESLRVGMKLIEGSVVANTVGRNFAAAKGLSVYFPSSRIDSSYPRTDFAKDCLWYDFLKEYVGK